MTKMEINEDIELSGGQARAFIESLGSEKYLKDPRRILRISRSFTPNFYDICHINKSTVFIHYDFEKKDYASITFVTENKENIRGALESLIEMTGFKELSLK